MDTVGGEVVSQRKATAIAAVCRANLIHSETGERVEEREKEERVEEKGERTERMEEEVDEVEKVEGQVEETEG